MTVFLTTQYLEEADQLADRVGIIDHGKIVAEGTPAELKAEIGRPSLEVVPAEQAEGDRVLAVLERFGERVPASREGAAVRLRGGAEQLTDIVRALDAEQLRCREHRPQGAEPRRRLPRADRPLPEGGPAARNRSRRARAVAVGARL